MSDLPKCPECAHEWAKNAVVEESDGSVVKDANGNVLIDGDTVSVILRISRLRAHLWWSRLALK